MWTKEFWLATAERAIKTFVQSFIAVFGVSLITDKEAFRLAGLAGLTAAFLSVLSSIASSPFGNDGPSLTTESIDHTPQILAEPTD